MIEFLVLAMFVVALACCISNAIESFSKKRYFWGALNCSFGYVILLTLALWAL